MMVSIEAAKDGPFIVKDLKKLTNAKGDIETKETMALCRCGASENKPLCDGAHTSIGFKGDKQEGRVEDKVDDYKGKEIAIHDNRGVCSHAGFCTNDLPSVFRQKKEPWIDSDGDKTETAIKQVKKCPSGALSFSKDGVLHDKFHNDPAILVSKDGPYFVVGSPEFADKATGAKPESKEHYTLCRCGSSKNKPFCDGAHWYIKFKDEKN